MKELVLGFFPVCNVLSFWGVMYFGWGCPCGIVASICVSLIAMNNFAALCQTPLAAHKAAPIFRKGRIETDCSWSDGVSS